MLEDDVLENLFPKEKEVIPKKKVKSDLLEEYNPEDWLRTKDVGDLFGVDPKTVTTWRKNGRLNSVKSFRTPGGHSRFYAPDIKKLMSKDEDQATRG